MSFAAITLVTTLAVGSASAPAATGPLSAGAPAPLASTKMKSALDGKLVSIADVAGKAGTLVIFTCTHCPVARGWERRITELGNAYAKRGVGVILINANDPAKYPEDGFAEMQARVKSLGLQVPYVVDETSNVARAFGASVTPEAFLFDRGGKLAYHGTIDDNHKDPDQVGKRYLKDALEAVVGGKPPAVSETKGIGCGIKFR
jgi:peroxiredoxin